jgi:hypothetical protein
LGDDVLSAKPKFQRNFTLKLIEPEERRPALAGGILSLRRSRTLVDLLRR